MPADCDGEQRHYDLCPEVLINNSKDAVTDSYPNHSNGIDFDLKRDSTMDTEIAYIFTKDLMI